MGCVIVRISRDVVLKEHELKNSRFPFRDMQDLVKIRKPVVKRVGDVVKECHFFKETGQCFGSRCFWTRHGSCPFYERIKKTGKV